MKYCKTKCILNKINRPFEHYIAPLRRQGLTNLDFSIISNNCWAGRVYQFFNLPYSSPTIGLYFFPSDFNLFCNSLRYYTSLSPKIIQIENSKWRNKLPELHQDGKFPLIAKIEDIELMLLHYHSEQEFMEKWHRRCKRINFNNLIFKSNDQNHCTFEDFDNFCKLDLPGKKVFLCANKDWAKQNPSATYCKDYEEYGFVKDDTMFPNEFINLKTLINTPFSKQTYSSSP